MLFLGGRRPAQSKQISALGLRGRIIAHVPDKPVCEIPCLPIDEVTVE